MVLHQFLVPSLMYLRLLTLYIFLTSLVSGMDRIFIQYLSLQKSLRVLSLHHPSSPSTASLVVFPLHLRILLPISRCTRSASSQSSSPQTSHPYSSTDLTRA